MERTTKPDHRRAASRLTDRRAAPRAAGAAPAGTTATPEFPGCRPIHISRDRDRRLRGAPGVLGGGHRDRVGGPCTGQRLARASRTTPGAAHRTDRSRSGSRHRDGRQHGPSAPQSCRRAPAHPAGRPGRVSAPAGDPPDRPRHRNRPGRIPRRDPGGRSDDRRPPRQAGALRVLGVPRGVGRRSGSPYAEQPGRAQVRF